MSKKFKPGDVVRLRSGNGPAMTIDFCESDGAYCLWFSADFHLFRAFVPYEALSLVN